MKLFLAVLLSFVSFAANAEQSAKGILSANRKIIADFHELVGMQRSDPKVLKEAVDAITPHLKENDPLMALTLIHLAEKSIPKPGESESKIRFLILNSFGSLNELEDTTAFERLIDFYENEKDDTFVRTPIANSFRAAAIRSGHPVLLDILVDRAFRCKNQDAVADYIFYFLQEAKHVISTSWYLPWLLRKATDYSASTQVRHNAIFSLTVGIEDKFHLISPQLQTLIFEKLFFALKNEPNKKVKKNIISLVSGMSLSLFAGEIKILKDTDPDPEIRSAAESALLNGEDAVKCETKLYVQI